MRSMRLSRLTPGVALAQNIYDDKGNVLLKSGVPISEEYVRLLQRRGVTTVFVETVESAGIVIDQLLSDRLRARASRVSADTLQGARMIARQAPPQASNEGSPTLWGLGPLRNSLEIERAVPAKEIVEVARDLVDDLLEGAPRVTMPPPKGVDTYLFGHLVDVAAVSVQIGRKVGLKTDDLRRLARGALLHDIGQVFVDTNVDGKIGPLSSIDVESVRTHTTWGFEFLRRIPDFDPIGNHIAYQHHERQNGLGYPRGLEGDNHVRRESTHLVSRIHLLAEITAVADVYDSLCSDHPDRPTVPREVVFEVITRLAGSTLNRELVETFMTMVPIFPAGYPVRAATGRLAGCHGIVVRDSILGKVTPIVRFYTDQRGHRVQPFDVDLARFPDVRLASVASDDTIRKRTET